SLGLAEIECQVALVAIHSRLRESDLLVVTGKSGRDAARHFTLTRLYLDDVGAKVGENARAHRARPTCGRVDYADAVERASEIAARVTIEVGFVHVLFPPRRGNRTAGASARTIAPTIAKLDRLRGGRQG